MEVSDDDEYDFEDDGNDLVPAHDPDSEPLPDLPMYHPSLKEVEILSSQLISEFQYFISNSPYKDEETDYLLEESKVLEHPPHESHVLRIALIGDAGQGKSSLLNSMLGQENLAIHVSMPRLSFTGHGLTSSRLQMVIVAHMLSWNTSRQLRLKNVLSKHQLNSSPDKLVVTWSRNSSRTSGCNGKWKRIPTKTWPTNID